MSVNPDKETPVRGKLFDLHGVPMIECFASNWEKVQSFQARPDDILIATYPKAGTTWVSYILDLLYFGQTSPERQTSIPIYERVPFLESAFPFMDTGTELLEKLPTSPRIIKTHFPVQFVPKSFWKQNCKIIYVARNAKDNMVSYFYMDRMTLTQPDPGDWNTYFQRFMQGQLLYGSWYDHVNGWWKKKQSYANIHYMFYEDMIEVVFYILPSIIRYLLLFCNLSYKCDCGSAGKVGDWKNHFTVAQNEEFDEDYKKKINPALNFRTEL
eukprot:XP_011619153.1 PREDICTED: cytosolic sulfotransferase 3-like [Takifugu rubripes]